MSELSEVPTTEVEMSSASEFQIVNPLVEGLIEISDKDQELQNILTTLRAEIADPNIESIVLAINRKYPINPQATAAIRQFRATAEEPQPLGQYFLPTGEAPYSAVCAHKALLAQALASTYGISTDIVYFGFLGQIKEGFDDDRSGMHEVIRHERDGEVWIGDSHKGIYEKSADYWKRFNQPQIFADDIKVTEPASKT